MPTILPGRRPMSGPRRVRRELAERFPPIDGAPDLVDELLDLHSPRQLVGLAAIIARVEGDLRAAPVLAALRLAVLHAILPASRLTTGPGRTAPLRVAAGHVRLPGSGTWRERNPWVAFEDGFRMVRGFVQGLEAGAFGPVPARLGEDLRSLGEGTATALLGLAGAGGVRALGLDGRDPGRSGSPRVRLVLAQPPLRPALDRLAAAYHAAAWVLGREAATLVPAGRARGRLVARPVELAGCGHRPNPRVDRSRHGPRRPHRAPGRWRLARPLCRPSSAAVPPGSASCPRSWPTPTTTRAWRAAASERLPAARRREPGRTWRCRRSRAGRGIPTSSPVRACSRHPSGSTSARSRRWRRPARCPRPRSRC